MYSVVTSSRPSQSRTAVVEHEVVRPDVVGTFRSSPHAGSVCQPQPTAFRLPFRHFQPLLAPDPLYSFGIHPPTLPTKQRCDPSIAIATIFARQLDDPSHQPILVRGDLRSMPLSRSRLAQHSASPTLGHPQPLAHVVDGLVPSSRAQNFPEATSWRIALSSACSATSFLSRVFSFSSSFKRFA